MTAAPSGRERLDAIPAGTEALRAIRYMADDEFDGIADGELEAGVRWLRAAAHSAREGARRLDAVLRNRREHT